MSGKSYLRRVEKELRDLAKEENTFSIKPVSEDLSELSAIIEGPPETPYEGGTFKVYITIPNDYPFAPPKVRFDPGFFHPNVDYKTGGICVSILLTEEQMVAQGTSNAKMVSASWSPAYSIEKVLLSLQSMFMDPTLAHGLNPEAASLFERDPTEFEKKVKKSIEDNFKKSGGRRKTRRSKHSRRSKQSRQSRHSK
jgi:hypothetical protein